MASPRGWVGLLLGVLVMLSSGAQGRPRRAEERPRASGERPRWRLRPLRNFRDAGALAGLPTGRLYRSDDPRYRPFRSCERLRAAGIRTIVKLNGFQRRLRHRRRPRWRRGPCGLPELVVALPYSKTTGAHGMTIYQLGRRRGLSREKRRVVRYMERQLRLLFTQLAGLRESELPVLIHCSVGRDRTGIVLALLQRLAGAQRSAVERDYVESKKTVGHTSVVSLRRVLRRLGPVPRFLRAQLGLSPGQLGRLRRLVRGPRRARPRPRRPASARFGPPP
jgi:hypothetical protein